MFDIALDTLMLPIEREVAADIRKRLSSLSWRPNQIAVGSVRLYGTVYDPVACHHLLPELVVDDVDDWHH